MLGSEERSGCAQLGCWLLSLTCSYMPLGSLHTVFVYHLMFLEFNFYQKGEGTLSEKFGGGGKWYLMLVIPALEKLRLEDHHEF